MDREQGDGVTSASAAGVAPQLMGEGLGDDGVEAGRGPTGTTGSAPAELAAAGSGRSGDQAAARRDLAAGAESGDAGFAAGERTAPGCGGTGGGSVSASHEDPGPVNLPPIAAESALEPDLDALSAQIGGDPDIVDRFVRNYLDLLDERLPDIRRYLRSGHQEAANVALLSLESTTAMFGVPDIVVAVAALRAGVRSRCRDELLAEFAAVAGGISVLQQHLVLWQITRAAERAGPAST